MSRSNRAHCKYKWSEVRHVNHIWRYQKPRIKWNESSSDTTSSCFSRETATSHLSPIAQQRSKANERVFSVDSAHFSLVEWAQNEETRHSSNQMSKLLLVWSRQLISLVWNKWRVNWNKPLLLSHLASLVRNLDSHWVSCHLHARRNSLTEIFPLILRH